MPLRFLTSRAVSNPWLYFFICLLSTPLCSRLPKSCFGSLGQRQLLHFQLLHSHIQKILVHLGFPEETQQLAGTGDVKMWCCFLLPNQLLPIKWDQSSLQQQIKPQQLLQLTQVWQFTGIFSLSSFYGMRTFIFWMNFKSSSFRTLQHGEAIKPHLGYVGIALTPLPRNCKAQMTNCSHTSRLQ